MIKGCIAERLLKPVRPLDYYPLLFFHTSTTDTVPGHLESMKHIQDSQVIRPIQHGFMKGRSCLPTLFSFYDKVTRLVDEGKAVDVVYLDVSKAFDTTSHSILLEKLAAHGLDRCTLRWVKNWLDGWPKELR